MSALEIKTYPRLSYVSKREGVVDRKRDATSQTSQESMPSAWTLGLPGAPPPGPLGYIPVANILFIPLNSTLYISQLITQISITKNYITKKIQ